MAATMLMMAIVMANIIEIINYIDNGNDCFVIGMTISIRMMAIMISKAW